jgi:uncharacterized protein YlxP (DUF503 family)
MVVGVLRLTLYIHGASSLKDKRQVVRKATDRVRARYNVAIAEVGDNDVWQRAVLGVAAVANDHSFVNEVLDKVARDVESVAEIINRELEIETYSEMSDDWARMGKPDLELPEETDPEPELPEDEASQAGKAPEPGWLREEDLE